MSPFEDNTLMDIDWRTSELSILRRLELTSRKNPEENIILKKSVIVLIYALLEGFFTTTFANYINEINNKMCRPNELFDKIVTFDFDMNFGLKNSITDFNAKVDFYKKTSQYLGSQLILKTTVKTNSNVNFRVINQALEIHNLDPLNKKYDQPLNKLLFIRNNFAHGENSINIKNEEIDELSDTLVNVMGDLFLIINTGLKEQRYLK